MARHTYETTLTVADIEDREQEIDVKVAYDFHPASDDDDAEIDRVELLEVGGRARPWGFHSWSDRHASVIVAEMLEGSERHVEAMIEAAAEREAELEHEIAERAWEERRERAA